MNWSKAKNIIIILLIILNSALFIISDYANKENSLTYEREKAIIKLLNQNGIKLNYQLPKKYDTMPTISLIYKDINSQELKDIFFKEQDNVKRTVEFDSTVFKNDTETLILNDTSILYVNESNINKSGVIGVDKQTAKKIANQFMQDKFYEYKFHSINKLYNKYCINYYGNYKNYKLYSSYVKLYISGYGIESIEIVNYEPIATLGLYKEICSVDEALMTFIYEHNKEKQFNYNKSIDSIEIGYILEQETRKSENGRAIPCYMISVNNGEQKYFINAYTNTLIYEN